MITNVTIPDGVTRRSYASVAYYDETVTLIPGTYPVKVLNGYRITAAIPALSHDGSDHTYSLHIYDYEIPKYTEDGWYFFTDN